MINNSRENILKQIREGLQNASCKGLDIDQPKIIDRKNSFPTKSNDTSDLVEQFVSEISLVNGNAKKINNRNEVNEYVSNLFNVYKANTFKIWDSEYLNKLNLKEFLINKGFKNVESVEKEKLAEVEIGITELDYALADTGTFVLLTETKKQRLDSLIVPIHVVVLESRKIIKNIFELIDTLDDEYNKNSSKTLPSCITFITGPSRTADIEFILTLGVHGPKELEVLITDF